MQLFFNWKLNPSLINDSISLFGQYPTAPQGSCIVLPPALILQNLIWLNQKENKGYQFGVQEISDQQSGAYTGQNSAQLTRSLGAEYALIGHSETRMNLGVNCKAIINKVTASCNAGLIPIICVGHREPNDLERINPDSIAEQVISSLSGITKSTNPNMQCYIAYEPVWAIGTGEVPTEEEISTVLKIIKDSTLSSDYEGEIKLLYGGSVSDTTIGSMLNIPHLDGFLIGGASLKADKVNSLLTSINAIQI